MSSYLPRSFLDQLLANPHGLGYGPAYPTAPNFTYDEYGQPHDAQGNKIQQPDDPSLSDSLWNIGESPARLTTALASGLSPYGAEGWQVPPAIHEPVNALMRLAQNSRFDDGRLGIPNPQNLDNQHDTATLIESLFGGNATRGAGAVENAAAHTLHDVSPVLAPAPLGRPVQAAMRIGGQTFTGPNHALALMHAEDVLGKDFVDSLWSKKSGFGQENEGFVTKDGQYLTRQQAAAAVGRDPNDLATQVVGLHSSSLRNHDALFSDTGKPSILGAAVAGAERPGFDVWHGSPHDFDQFDLSKIGTGEGAQAYGHGLYFAENQGVAKGYRDNLGRNSQLKGVDFNPDGSPNRAGMAATHLDAGISPERTREALEFLEPNASPEQIDSWLGQGRQIFDDAHKAGYLYQARINADPEHFLDWDKSFGQQPQSVQEIAQRLIGAPAGTNRMLDDRFLATPTKSGGYEYTADGSRIARELGLSDTKGFSNALREAGIPGIKYLDGGSRAAGDGSRNYVVFDHNLVDTLHKWRGDQQLYSDNLPSLWGNALSQDQQPQRSRDPLLDMPPAIVQEQPGLSGLQTFASGGNVADTSGLSGLQAFTDDDASGIGAVAPRLAPSLPYHSFLEQLAANPHGWGSSPRNTGSISLPSDPYYGTGGPSIPAQIGYGLSGIPLAMEGIQSAREGSLAGDPLRTAGGVGETLLSALPMSGTATRLAFGTMPRAIASGSLAGTLPSLASGALSSEDAEAGQKKQRQSGYQAAPAAAINLPGLSPEQNVQYQQLSKRIQNSDWSSGSERKSLFAAQQQLQDLSADYQRQNNAGLAKAAEIKATADAQRAADQARAQQEHDQLVTEANTPFKEAHPYLATAIPAITGGIAGGIGARLGYGSARAFQTGIDDLSAAWSKAANAAESAFSMGDTLAASRYAHEAANLKDQFNSLASQGAPGISKSALLGTAGLGELGQIAPIIIDKSRAQPGSPLEEETNQQMALTQENLPNIAGRVLMGGLWGGLSGKVGNVVGKAAYGATELPTLGAAAGAKADAIQTMLQPRAMEDPTTALGALKDYQSARQGFSGPTQTLLPPPTEPGPGAAAPLPELGPRPGSPSTPAKSPRKSRGQRTTAPQASPASSAESSSGVSPEAKAAAEAELRRYLQNNPDRKAAGGAVDGNGMGSQEPVHVGPLHSHDGGRTDTLPISVRAGSFVVPADIVSALGESNTAAGMRVLDHMFPREAESLHYSAGGAVPIVAAGGEYVVPPETVARIGGGNLDHGHNVLDQFVLNTRNDTINTLKSLPGPQK